MSLVRPVPRTAGKGLHPTLEPEHQQLLAALLDGLRTEGVPGGSWLIEIEQARLRLAEMDALLRRLSKAIVAGYERDS